MSETIIPEEIEQVTSDVATEQTQPELNLSGKTLDQLVELFQQLGASADRLTRSKEAEAIKSSFYKLLGKLKGEAAEAAEAASATAEGAIAAANSKFAAVEESFKGLYADYKKERAEYNRQLDAERADNLTKKQAVIEDLKALVEGQEDVNTTFPKLREIQARWREIGPVPATNYRDINDSYQFYVEKFYDMVKINHDLRDLDFKKNLEAKQAFCEAAEKLSENENVVSAFAELQKLHEQWKEFGPVAKEYRDEIWDRFKAATAVINKKYQSHFEEIKGQQAENLEAKTKLCEKVETIAEAEVADSNAWNALSKEIEDIQAEWKKIGFVTRKENQKIYDRFRAACDKFFERKRVFYSQFKDSMNENVDRKMAIIEKAEALKTSTDWKKATDQFITLQKEWKEIGAVPRKKSEQLWKRFRAACDEFFAERDKQAKPENDFYANLKAKKQVIEEILSFKGEEGTSLAEAAKAFTEKFQSIGFVPFKEKDNIAKAFKEAMQQKFPSAGRPARSGRLQKVLSPKEELIRKYNALQQDIDTYENNIGFFAASKNSAPLIAQMQERIDAAKAELKELEEKIRNTEEE